MIFFKSFDWQRFGNVGVGHIDDHVDIDVDIDVDQISDAESPIHTMEADSSHNASAIFNLNGTDDHTNDITSSTPYLVMIIWSFSKEDGEIDMDDDS